MTATADVLGEPYTAETHRVPRRRRGPRRRHAGQAARGRSRTSRAVLHVHGFADYFFQTEYAEWWIARGLRLLRARPAQVRPVDAATHQTPNYVDRPAEYFPELDAAWRRITEPRRPRPRRRQRPLHRRADPRRCGPTSGSRPSCAGMVLNSPWFDMQGHVLMRGPSAPRSLDQVGARQPMREIPRKVSGLYTRSLHRDHEGEWDFDLALEAGRVVAGVRRMAARDPARPRPAPPRARRPLPGAGALVRRQRPPARDGRRRAPQRHRARRGPDPALVARPRPARHVGRRRRTPGTTSCSRCPRSGRSPTTRWTAGCRRTWTDRTTGTRSR